ncbi:MAG: outer membrane beta-barrel protein [Alphaproteobacteria bacterium]|nr:outer membrane beta-barrel protein [Alphaproteobacteria bacterium]
MKRSLLLAVMTVAGMCSAQAADMGSFYSKGRSIPAAIYDWSGLYVGLNGGYATAGSGGADGGTFGGQVGYRWQNSNWVLGAEGQGNWVDFGSRGGHVSASIWNASASAGGSVHGSSGLGMFTGQLGYAASNVLLYVKGGAAVVNSKADWNLGAYTSLGPLSNSARLSGRTSATSWGGVFGAGLEYGFAPNWSVGVEYNRVFSDSDYSGADINLGLVRLNYRFGGPVVARY